MPTYFAHADLPYAPQQVFDLVADIESYPKFLHHVAAARIRRRNGNMLWVDQVVRFAMLRLHFSTRAVLEPPSRIHVVCNDSLFGTFDETWSFADAPSGGTRLECHATYELRSGLIRMVLGPALSDLLGTSVKAFQARARQIYGSAASVSSEPGQVGVTSSQSP
nr:type II toxin-antitoxin system RatA family toxin [uncultured Rhodopila sp.]